MSYVSLQFSIAETKVSTQHEFRMFPMHFHCQETLSYNLHGVRRLGNQFVPIALSLLGVTVHTHYLRLCWKLHTVIFPTYRN